MKKFEYYLKQEKELLERKVKEGLKNGPVPIAIDCIIESFADMEKSSVRFAMKRRAKRSAEISYNLAKKPVIQMIIPVPGSALNGVPLDPTIPLPIYAPSTHDTEDYNNFMLATGLVEMLKVEKDDYYLSLLKSFNFNKKQITPILKSMLKGKYWNEKRFKRDSGNGRDESERNIKKDGNSVQDISKPGEPGNSDSKES